MVETALKCHECRIFRRMLHLFDQSDVFSADRGFCLMNLALLERGAHAVMRAHQMRQLDYRQGKGLDLRPDCHMDTPDSSWYGLESMIGMPCLSSSDYASCVSKSRQGFRVHQYDLVTTLTDADIYTKDELAESFPALGSGAVLSPNQDDYGNGKLAPNSGNGSQRTADALDRLQLNPRSNAGSCHTGINSPRTSQL